MKALVLIALLAGAAHADDMTPRARVFAERGRAMHAVGNYAAAIDAYKQAYVIAPNPAILFNLAQAYRLEGDCDDASIFYQRYLSSDPDPDARVVAETQLASVDRCAREHAPIASPRPHATPPVAVAMTLAPPPPHSRLERDIGIGLGLAGGIAVGTAAYFAVVAHGAAGDVSDAYANGAKGKDVAADDARGRRAARNAEILGGAGALAIGGGIALYLLGTNAEHVEIAPTHGGGQVSMSWAW